VQKGNCILGSWSNVLDVRVLGFGGKGVLLPPVRRIDWADPTSVPVLVRYDLKIF